MPKRKRNIKDKRELKIIIETPKDRKKCDALRFTSSVDDINKYVHNPRIMEGKIVKNEDGDLEFSE